MAILAERVIAVVGVDTHTDIHAAAVLSAAGAVLAQVKVGTDLAGLAGLIAWADQHCPPGPRAWVIDGARSHGVGLTRHLREHYPADELIEADRDGNKARRRRNGKSDAIDAVEIGRAALSASKVATPRGDGTREALRILLVARRHHTDARTATVNLLKANILTAEPQLREQLRGRTTLQQVRALCHGTLATPGLDLVAQVRLTVMTDLATDIAVLDQRLKNNHDQIRQLVKTQCQPLLDEPGVGPVTAAYALLAWSHRGRVRNEGAFAKLAGVSPIDTGSGANQRHRLNTGGDRALNAALHTIAVTRRRCHPPTRAYVQRRTTAGRNSREITRSLKRYIARKIFRIIETNTLTP